MPYKFETERKTIPRELKRNVKLSNEDKLEIKELKGKISQRKCAKAWNVSRSTIRWIWMPEKLERNKELREERGGDKYYYYKHGKEYHTKQVKATRRYKQMLSKQNKLEKVNKGGMDNKTNRRQQE